MPSVTKPNPENRKNCSSKSLKSKRFQMSTAGDCHHLLPLVLLPSSSAASYVQFKDNGPVRQEQQMSKSGAMHANKYVAVMTTLYNSTQHALSTLLHNTNHVVQCHFCFQLAHINNTPQVSISR